MDIATQLQAVDRATLTPIVRWALQRDGAVVDEWRVEPLYVPGAVFNPSNGGVYRLAGSASDGGVPVAWSLVVKVLRSPAGTVLPDGQVVTPEQAENMTLFAYWQREALAYASGLLDDQPDGLAAPRLYGSTDWPGPSVWLWLEEVADTDGGAWPLARYGLAARHFGAFNGAYLAGRPLPDAPWLCQGWLRSCIDTVIIQLIAYMEQTGAWDQPVIRRACPPSLSDRLRRLWDEREAFLAALDQLPQVLCHLDAFRSNLMARRVDGRDETVALDWAFVGPAAVGEEVSALVAASLLRGAVAIGEAGPLDEACFTGYLEGLRAAGWQGDPRAVRLGYTASVALRYSFMTLFDIVRTLMDEGHAAALEREEGLPFADIVAGRIALASFLLDRADEARALLDAR